MTPIFAPRLRHMALPALATAALALACGTTGVSAQNLASFAILAGSTVTNTGSSVIGGNVGVSPGSAITGFPGLVTAPYTIYRATAVSAQMQSDLTTAYNILAARPATANLTGVNLGGQVLTAGVYNFDSSALLTGTLTLDGQGNPNAVFIINIGTELTTAAGSSVVLINGANAANVYYRVGSSATLGAGTAFQGKILALTSITLVTGASINCGAALARNGAVTLDTNVITVCAVAPAIDVGVIFPDGSVLPLGFQVLSVLTPAELEAALIQLSGYVATAVGPTAFGAMNQFMNLANTRGPGTSGPSAAPDTVSVMGYMGEPAPFAAFAELDSSYEAEPGVGFWEIWAAVNGGYSLTRGEGGTFDRTSHSYGLATGIDYRANADTDVGFAVSLGGTGFSLSDKLSSGRSDMIQAMLYGTTDFDAAYLSGAVGYGFHLMTTDRFVTFAGIDHFRASFPAHNIAAELEAGYHIGMVTPYAAVRGQALFTPAYSETTVSGASTFALDYAARMASTVRTELGVKVDWSEQLDDGVTLGLHTQAAWLHYFQSSNTVNASFQAIPGSSITSTGAMGGTDSLLLSATADVAFDNGTSVALSLNGEFARNSESYGASLKIGHSW